MSDIFTELMNLIEKRTDIPRLEADIEDWLKESDRNKSIYEIYRLASEAREMEE